MVEVVEQERENLPGRNTLHFPTSKEKTWLKARHLIQQQELQRQEQRDGKATVVSSPDDIHDHIGGISQEDFRISQQEDAVQRLRREQIKWANDSSRKAYSSSDSDEDAVEFSRTRRRLKASRQRSRSDARPSKVHQATVTECIEAANTPESIAKVFESGTKGSAVQSCAITAVTASSPAVFTKGPNAPPMPSSVDSRGPVQNLSSKPSASSSTGPKTSTDASLGRKLHAGVVGSAAGQQLGSPVRGIHSTYGTAGCAAVASNSPSPKRAMTISATASVVVLIQDYAFSHSELDVHLGQQVQFLLADDTPWHAEHDLVGSCPAGNACLEFESGLLHKGGLTAYTFNPICSGEMQVQCKVYPDMQCLVRVHEDDISNYSSGSLFRSKDKPKRRGVMHVASARSPAERVVSGVSNHRSGGGRDHSITPFPALGSGFCSSTSTSIRGPDASPGRSAHILDPVIEQWPQEHGDCGSPTANHQQQESQPLRSLSLDIGSHTSGRPSGPPPAGSGADSRWGAFTPVQGVSYRVLPSAAMSGELSESQSSFYDSDDIFSDCEASLGSRKWNVGTMSPGVLASALSSTAEKYFNNGTPAERTVNPTRSMTLLPPAEVGSSMADVDVDDDHGYRNDVEDGQASWEEENEDDDDMQSDELDRKRQETVTVVLDDYNFRPKELVVRCGTHVRFRRKGSGPAVCLSCDGEFSSHDVSHHRVNVTHTFSTPGSYEIRNEIYSFMVCNVDVTSTSCSISNSVDSFTDMVGSSSQTSSYSSGISHSMAGSGLGSGSSRHTSVPKLQGSFAMPAVAQHNRASIEQIAHQTGSSDCASSNHSSCLPAERYIKYGSRADTGCSGMVPCSTVTTTVDATTTTVTTTSVTTTTTTYHNRSNATNQGSALSAAAAETAPSPTASATTNKPAALFGSFTQPLPARAAMDEHNAAAPSAAVSADGSENEKEDVGDDSERDEGERGTGKTYAQRKKAKQKKKFRLKKKAMASTGDESMLSNAVNGSVLSSDLPSAAGPVYSKSPLLRVRNEDLSSPQWQSLMSAEADCVVDFDSDSSDEEEPASPREAHPFENAGPAVGTMRDSCLENPDDKAGLAAATEKKEAQRVEADAEREAEVVHEQEHVDGGAASPDHGLAAADAATPSDPLDEEQHCSPSSPSKEEEGDGVTACSIYATPSKPIPDTKLSKSNSARSKTKSKGKKRKPRESGKAEGTAAGGAGAAVISACGMERARTSTEGGAIEAGRDANNTKFPGDSSDDKEAPTPVFSIPHAAPTRTLLSSSTTLAGATVSLAEPQPEEGFPAWQEESIESDLQFETPKRKKKTSRLLGEDSRAAPSPTGKAAPSLDAGCNTGQISAHTRAAATDTLLPRLGSRLTTPAPQIASAKPDSQFTTPAPRGASHPSSSRLTTPAEDRMLRNYENRLEVLLLSRKFYFTTLLEIIALLY